MKKLIPLLALATLPLVRSAHAQSVGIGTPTPNAKAVLDLTSTTQGLLVPRLTAGQRGAITTPPQGLMVYQTDGTASGGPQTGFWYYAGSPATWVFLNPAPAGDNLGNHTATQNLNLTDKLLVGGTAGLPSTDGLKIAGSGKVGIGLGAAAPAYQLDVNGTINGHTYYLDDKLGLSFGNTQANNNAFLGTGATPGISTTGTNNTAAGTGAAANLSGGTYNTFVGVGAGYQVHNGNHNTALGYYAGYSLNLSNPASTASNDNTYLGYQAAQYADQAAGNTALGTNAGLSLRGGDNNTFLGNEADLSSYLTQRTNATAIGYQAKVNQDNSLVLGNSAVSVGIGTSAPNSRLSLSPSVVEPKITLWDGGSTTDHYGFGVSGGQLNYHVGSTSDAHVFSAGGKNGDGTELARFTGAGRLGIGTAAPFSMLANTATNIVGADGYGVGTKSLTWNSNLAGYTAAIYNANPGVGQNGLAVKVNGANAAATALDVSQGPVGVAGASLLAVRANGYVGLGTAAPNATLEVRRGLAPDGTAAFWGTARTSHFNYSTAEDTYIRGGKASSNVYINDTGGNVGVGTSSVPQRLTVAGTALANNNSTSTAAVIGANANTGGFATGVQGTVAGNGYGVQGTAGSGGYGVSGRADGSAGRGVDGFSLDGTGAYAETQSGYAMQAIVSNTGANNGWALKAQATDGLGVRAIATTGQALWASAAGTGPAATIAQSGTGPALQVTGGTIETVAVSRPGAAAGNMLPLAIGNISINGLIQAGHAGDFTVTHPSIGLYYVTFTGQTYNNTDYVTMIQLTGTSTGDPLYYQATGGKLLIQVNGGAGGALSNSSFNFIVYKP